MALPFSDDRVWPELVTVAEQMEGGPGQVAQRFLRFWMDRTTGYGFGAIPAAGGRARLRIGAVRLDPLSRVLCQRVRGQMVISANGRSIVILHDPELAKWIGALSCRRVCEIAELLPQKRHKSRAREKERRQAIKLLLAEQAVRYV